MAEQKEKFKGNDNYYDRVIEQFEEAERKGEVNAEALKDIAERNKEDFFGMVKDFFKSPLKALKWYATRFYKEIYEGWKGEVNEAYEGVKNKAEKVVDVAKSGFGNLKDKIEKAPAIAKGTLAYAVGKDVYNFLAKNPDEAKKMPKDKKEQLKWWREIMVKAGVDKDKAAQEDFLDIISDEKTWEDIGDKVSGKKLNAERAKAHKEGKVEHIFSGPKVKEVQEQIAIEGDLLKNKLDSFYIEYEYIINLLVAYGGYEFLRKGKALETSKELGLHLMEVAKFALAKSIDNAGAITLLVLGATLTEYDQIAIREIEEFRLPGSAEEVLKIFDKTNTSAYLRKNNVKIPNKSIEQALRDIKNPKNINGIILESNTIVVEAIQNAHEVVFKKDEDLIKSSTYRSLDLLGNHVANIELSTGDKRAADDFKMLMSQVRVDMDKNKETTISYTNIQKINSALEKRMLRLVVIGDYITLKKVSEEGVLSDENIMNVGVAPLMDIGNSSRAARKLIRSPYNDVGYFLNSGKALADIANIIVQSSSNKVGNLREDAKEALIDFDKAVEKVSENVITGGLSVMAVSGKFFIIQNGKNVGDAVEVSSDFYQAVVKNLYKNYKGENVNHSEYIGAYAATVVPFAVISLVKNSPEVIGKMLEKISGTSNKSANIRDLKKLKVSNMTMKFLGETFAGPLVWPARGMVAINAARNKRLGEYLKTDQFKMNAAAYFRGIADKATGGSFTARWKSSANLDRAIYSSNMSILMKARRDITSYWRPSLASKQLSELKGTQVAAIGDALEQIKVKTNIDVNDIVRNSFKKFGKTEFLNADGSIKSINGEILNDIIRSIQAESKKAFKPVSLRSGLTNLKQKIQSTAENFKKRRNAATVIDRVDIGKRSGGGKLTNGLKVTGIEGGKLETVVQRKGLLGAFDRFKGGVTVPSLDAGKLKGLKNSKLAKGGAIGAVIIGASMAFSNTAEAAEGPKIEMKESKTKEVNELAQMIIGAETLFQERVTNKELLKEFANSESATRRTQIIGGIKKDYMSIHRELMNYMMINRKKLRGKLGEVAEVVKSISKSSKFKIENTGGWISDEAKELSIMNGMIILSEDKAGVQSIARQEADVFEDNITLQAGIEARGLLDEIGGSMMPLYGTGKEFARFNEAIDVGNNDKAIEHFGMGVSSLATDALIPLKIAGGGAKALLNATKFKKLTKLAKMKKIGFAGLQAGGTVVSLGAMGLDIFKDKTTKKTVIKNYAN